MIKANYIHTKKNGDKIYCYGIAKEVLNGACGLNIAYNYIDKKDEKRLSKHYGKNVSGGADYFGEGDLWDGNHDIAAEHDWKSICEHFEDYENKMVCNNSGYPAICELEAI